jgi:microcystin degradation protein MlrC
LSGCGGEGDTTMIIESDLRYDMKERGMRGMNVTTRVT